MAPGFDSPTSYLQCGLWNVVSKGIVGAWRRWQSYPRCFRHEFHIRQQTRAQSRFDSDRRRKNLRRYVRFPNVRLHDGNLFNRALSACFVELKQRRPFRVRRTDITEQKESSD